MDKPSSAFRPSASDVGSRQASQAKPLTTEASVSADDRGAFITGQSNVQNQAQEHYPRNPARSPDLSQNFSANNETGRISLCFPDTLQKVLRSADNPKSHFEVLPPGRFALKQPNVQALPQDVPQVRHAQQPSGEVKPIATSLEGGLPSPSEGKSGVVHNGGKIIYPTSSPNTHHASPSSRLQHSAMRPSSPHLARKKRNTQISPTAHISTPTDSHDSLTYAMGTKHHVRRAARNPSKMDVKDVMKENEALLQEVDAIKRLKKPEKSMLKQGVQKLIAVPRDRHVYGDLARKYTTHFASRLTAQNTSTQSAPTSLANGKDPKSPLSDGTFKRVASAVRFFVGVVLVAFVVSLVLVSASGTEQRYPQAQLCTTKDCQLHALYLSYRVNNSVRPCDDFQAYVCSAWRPPEGYYQVAKTAISEVVVSWMGQLRRLLKESNAGGLPRRKALFLLDACMAKRKPSPTDAKVFRSFMAKLNLYWPGDPPPNVSALGVLLNLAYNWRLTFWLDLKLVVDPEDSQRHKLIIRESSRDELLFLSINHKQLLVDDSYIAYWKTHYMLLYGGAYKGVSRDHVITEMYESASVQGDVISTLLATAMKHPKSPVVTTVGKIESYTSGRLLSTDWIQGLREHLSLPGTDSIIESTKVLVSDLMVLESIGRLFATYGDAGIIRQMSWEFVQLHILAVDRTPLEISFSGRRYAVPYIAVYCSRYVESVYGPLLASLYTRLQLSVGDRQAMDANFAGLIDAAIEKVNTSSWLGARSKSEAIKKIRAIRTAIWPQPLYYTDDGLETAYSEFPHDVNASFLVNWIDSHEALRRSRETPLYADTTHLHRMISFSLVDYYYLTNEVRVAISALTNPVYYAQGSHSMFYGGLGFLYSSEMLKALDETGRKVRTDGTVFDSWQSSEVDALERKRNCQGVRHNGSFLASLGALELSYSVFQATRKVDVDRRVSRNFTEDQVFFFTVCRMLCDLPNAEPASISCNALLRNSPEFSAAFGCRRGSAMNPKEKCRYF